MSIKDNIRSFDHLGLPVSNLEKSISFYEELGFTISSRQKIEEAGGTTKVAFLDLKEFCLELYQSASGPGSRVSEGGPVDHIALQVIDIEEVLDQIKQKELPLLQNEPVFLPMHEKGIKYFNITGPDGEKIEFIQKL